jgi:small nuclear ribonucleoprotein E
MNVVLDETEEVYDCSAKPGKEAKPRRSLGAWYKDGKGGESVLT